MTFTGCGSVVLLALFVAFAATIPGLRGSSIETDAHIGEFDDFLRKRAEDALQASLRAYNPDPEAVTANFTRQVGKMLEGGNETRRQLKAGDCAATNPIDRCWRCDPDWAKNRKRLAKCARGFGRQTKGGMRGKYYVVVDPSDDNVQDPKPGTLRHAVIQQDPLWIIFDRSMVIKLNQELLINSDKTIDGRGVEVHIAYGAGLSIQFVQNVIIHNIKIHHIVPKNGGLVRDSISHIGLRTRSDGDGISIFGSNRVWIDHVSLSRCSDGLIDAIMASTAITISNCKFNNHNDVILLGASDEHSEDAIMQVTVAFNRFGKGLVQRMPRCRWGFFHVVNNDYSQWQMYAIGGSAHPTIISQGNRFKAAKNQFTKEVTKRDYAEKSEWMGWQWRSEGDKFLNGAFFVESGPPLKKSPFTGKNKLQFKPGSYAGRLTRYAGALECREGKPC